MNNSKRISQPFAVKKISSIAGTITLFAMFILFIQSCKKEDVIEPNVDPTITTTVNQDEFVKCKIDGQDFLSYDDSRYYHYIANTAGPNKWLNLRGSNIDVNGIAFLFWNFNGVGEYDISSASDSCSLQYNIGLTSNPSYVCDYTNANAGTTSGKIKVTVHDAEKIEGTFEFTAINSQDPSDRVEVTEGSFRILR